MAAEKGLISKLVIVAGLIGGVAAGFALYDRFAERSQTQVLEEISTKLSKAPNEESGTKLPGAPKEELKPASPPSPKLLTRYVYSSMVQKVHTLQLIAVHLAGEDVQNVQVGAWMLDNGKVKSFGQQKFAYIQAGTPIKSEFFRGEAVGTELVVCISYEAGNKSYAQLELRDTGASKRDDRFFGEPPLKTRPLAVAGASFDCGQRGSVEMALKRLASS